MRMRQMEFKQTGMFVFNIGAISDLLAWPSNNFGALKAYGYWWVPWLSVAALHFWFQQEMYPAFPSTFTSRVKFLQQQQNYRHFSMIILRFERTEKCLHWKVYSLHRTSVSISFNLYITNSLSVRRPLRPPRSTDVRGCECSQLSGEGRSSQSHATWLVHFNF